MINGDNIGCRNTIPVIYTRGTHYEVGHDIGRTFSGLIQNFLVINSFLNKTLLPVYETEAGKKAYRDTLAVVEKSYPQYVRELEGIANGAKVPFYKLFVLHIDEILNSVAKQNSEKTHDTGCSTVCCNEPGEEILAHNEDAIPEVLGHYYIVAAHIISTSPQGRWKVKEEHFSSFCYAGFLPGFTMSYNHHGFIFSCNSIRPRRNAIGKMPGTILTRALLAAENLDQAQSILSDSGCGSAEGFNINMTFLNQEGDRLFHNAEVGPAIDGADESSLCIFTASPGEHIYHCNTYLRLQVPEVEETMASSKHRLATLNTFPKPSNRKDVINMLGDQSDEKYPVFRESPNARTVAVGIFDCVKKTWSLYADNPKTNDPVIVLPLQLKNFNK